MDPHFLSLPMHIVLLGHEQPTCPLQHGSNCSGHHSLASPSSRASVIGTPSRRIPGVKDSDREAPTRHGLLLLPPRCRRQSRRIPDNAQASLPLPTPPPPTHGLQLVPSAGPHRVARRCGGVEVWRRGGLGQGASRHDGRTMSRT
jgi:hypothetical protein